MYEFLRTRTGPQWLAFVSYVVAVALLVGLEWNQPLWVIGFSVTLYSGIFAGAALYSHRRG